MTEIISERVTVAHVRASGVPMRSARMLFERHGLSWTLFQEQGVAAADLRKIDDALVTRLLAAAVAETPAPEAELHVYMRHVRAAELCSQGSREFFRKHDLDWNAFLTNGIAVSEIQKIGDPLALRAAEQAVKEDANGRG